MNRLEMGCENTRNRWRDEAILFCARHGAGGGLFDVYRWANGAVMAEPVLTPDKKTLIRQWIPLETLNQLRRSGWKITQEMGVGAS